MSCSKALFQRLGPIMIAQHGRFLDGTETAHLFGERQEFYARVVIGGSQGRENAGDKLFILRDQRSLRAPLGSVSEQIENSAAQATTPSENSQRRPKPRAKLTFARTTIDPATCKERRRQIETDPPARGKNLRHLLLERRQR